MMTLVDRRALAAVLTCCVASACTAPKDPRAAAKDPGAPAVVQAAAPIVPMDTMRRPTASTGDAVNDARRVVSANYGVLGAAMAFGDMRTIGTLFAPDAEVITPDTTYKGLTAIVNGLARLASGRNLRAFQRQSLVAKIVDSTLTDSGEYVVRTKSGGATALAESGRYATVWRMSAPPKDWVIMRDHLYRDAVKKNK